MHRLVESFVQENHLHHLHLGILVVGEEADAVQAVGKVETAAAAAVVHGLVGVSKLKRNMKIIRFLVCEHPM